MSQDGDSTLVPLSIQYGKIPHGMEPDTLLLMSIDEDGDNRWKSVGTAFPFLHGGVLSIVTAAHVVASLGGFPLYALNHKNRKFVSLKNSRVLYSKNFDIAIIQLDSSNLSDLFGTCTCIEADLNCISSEDSGLDTFYQMHGFPRSKNKFSRLDPFDTFELRVTLGTPKPLPSKSKLAAIGMPTLCFDLGIDNLLDDDGNKTQQIGKFDGISGGPVFRYVQSSTGSLEGTLVGMFVEWHAKERTAVAIPISVIATWIEVQCS
jgi:hypothetical protein